jgi:hypothetical protein
MGNLQAIQNPSHIRIYKELLRIQNPATRTEMILDDVKRLIGTNLEKVKEWLFGIKIQVIGGQIKIKNPMMVFLWRSK